MNSELEVRTEISVSFIFQLYFTIFRHYSGFSLCFCLRDTNPSFLLHPDFAQVPLDPTTDF